MWERIPGTSGPESNSMAQIRSIHGEPAVQEGESLPSGDISLCICREVIKLSCHAALEFSTELGTVMKLSGLPGDVNHIMQECPAMVAHKADEMKVTFYEENGLLDNLMGWGPPGVQSQCP